MAVDEQGVDELGCYPFRKEILIEGRFLTTLCSNCMHSFNLTCHTHKGNATEMTKTLSN